MKKTMMTLLAVLFLMSARAGEAEFGIASYYSNKFHGKKTASGEIYSKDKMTCAHKTLPFGTIIRVTRLDTKKTVSVRVNDRGPYVSGWVTDVSYKAAVSLGMISSGSVKVKVEVLEYPKGKTPAGFQPPADVPEVEKAPELTAKGVSTPPAGSATATPPVKEIPKSYNPSPTLTKKSPAAPVKPVAAPKAPAIPRSTSGTNGYGLYKIQLVEKQAGYAVQVSSLKEYENMMRLIADLQKKGMKNVLLSLEKGPDSKPVYKVLLGPFSSSQAAEKAMNDARKKKYITGGYVIKIDSLKYD